MSIGIICEVWIIKTNAAELIKSAIVSEFKMFIDRIFDHVENQANDIRIGQGVGFVLLNLQFEKERII